MPRPMGRRRLAVRAGDRLLIAAVLAAVVMASAAGVASPSDSDVRELERADDTRGRAAVAGEGGGALTDASGVEVLMRGVVSRVSKHKQQSANDGVSRRSALGESVVCMLPANRHETNLGAWFAANHRCTRVIILIADPGVSEGELPANAEGERCAAAQRAAERRRAVGASELPDIECATVNVVLPSGRADSSQNVWEKLMASWLWMARAHASGHRMLRGSRWVLKLDVDGIALPANFERLAREQGWDANATTHPWYVGHTLTYRVLMQNGPPFNVGQYALSIGAVRAVAPHLRKAIAAMDAISVRNDPAFQQYKEAEGLPLMEPNSYCANTGGSHADDFIIAACLGLADIRATPAVDSLGRHYFLPFNPRAHRWQPYAEHDATNPMKSWFWEGKTRAQSEEACCAPRVVAIHGFKEERSLLEWGFVIDLVQTSTSFD